MIVIAAAARPAPSPAVALKASIAPLRFPSTSLFALTSLLGWAAPWQT